MFKYVTIQIENRSDDEIIVEKGEKGTESKDFSEDDEKCEDSRNKGSK